MNRSRWIVRPFPEDPFTTPAEAGRSLGVSPTVAQLLLSRGLESLEEMEVFLNPGLRHLCAPESVPGLREAAEALARGLERGKRMAVWGDYDVDGVTSTAMCMDFLKKRGFAAVSHIPDRREEGYGLNTAGIERLAEDGVELLLTVDCGVSDVEPIERARELGMEVVVSDHHLPPDELPRALAVCNPRLGGDCACADLAGVGVAFFLLAALNRLLPGDPVDMRQYLDLVALGTLADVVPLQGQNRILAKNGLLLIKEAARPGLFALKEAAGFAPQAPLGAGQVVFGLAPRINAAGRLGHARDALDMLLAPDKETARPLAAKLDELNSTRRGEEEAITKAALEQAEPFGERPGIVVAGEDWHPGVIGIVASRLVERFYRPALVLTRENGLLKGSGRSTREFDLHGGLGQCAHLLEGYGGHKQAAGLSLLPENLDALRAAFESAVNAQLGEEMPPPSLLLDAELGLEGIDHVLLRELEMMQPFGAGNPEPAFLSPRLTVEGMSRFGKNHLKMRLRDADSGRALKAKAWRQADEISPKVAGKQVRVAFTPKIDTYGGVPTIEMHVRDLRVDEDVRRGTP
ncbi:single-stranded-DNA-specific exonuclease RecJ [Desulfohalovibrio reitneri]|uniref:single-stranded-DNA-specific exonuclease RecJ n=1 Tax=Desulfohalovibrio reitneri TaxID=1307759 RepID=UPI0004A722FC|nr:single-stranded-DNA-specific exonuclease RecJ [Desulfohalovibrio reitneri]